MRKIFLIQFKITQAIQCRSNSEIERGKKDSKIILTNMWTQKNVVS